MGAASPRVRPAGRERLAGLGSRAYGGRTQASALPAASVRRTYRYDHATPPALRSRPHHPSPPRVRSRPRGGSGRPGGTARPEEKRAVNGLLVVEDDDALAAALRTLLAQDGHDVVRAPNGREGLRLLSARRPVLLLRPVRIRQPAHRWRAGDRAHAQRRRPDPAARPRPAAQRPHAAARTGAGHGVHRVQHPGATAPARRDWAATASSSVCRPGPHRRRRTPPLAARRPPGGIRTGPPHDPQQLPGAPHRRHLGLPGGPAPPSPPAEPAHPVGAGQPPVRALRPRVIASPITTGGATSWRPYTCSSSRSRT